MKSSIHIQLAKWTVPAVAFVVALFWYKRRRIDKRTSDELQWNDSGGTAKSNHVEKAILNDTLEGDTGLYDSDVQKEINQRSSVGCCYTQQEEPTRVPRKVSESMDIPLKNLTSQFVFCNSSQIKYEDIETTCSADVELDSTNVKLGSTDVELNSTNIELGSTDVKLSSNSNASYFEMITTNASSKFNENVDNITRMFQNVIGEEQTVHCKTEPSEQNYTDEYNYKEDGQQSERHIIKIQGQEVDERDSANHSPVSVVLDGSVTDEAGSEGSNTDSGKGEY